MNIAKDFNDTLLGKRESYVANAFSLQMLTNGNSLIRVTEVSQLPNNLVSAIGHQDTAAVLGVEVNRVNVSLKEGDTLYVAQLMGGRLPEGSTTLPEGFTFKYLKVEVLFKEITMCLDHPEGTMLDYSTEMDTFYNVSLEEAYNGFKKSIETAPVWMNQDEIYYSVPRHA